MDLLQQHIHESVPANQSLQLMVITLWTSVTARGRYVLLYVLKMSAYLIYRIS